MKATKKEKMDPHSFLVKFVQTNGEVVETRLGAWSPEDARYRLSKMGYIKETISVNCVPVEKDDWGKDMVFTPTDTTFHHDVCINSRIWNLLRQHVDPHWFARPVEEAEHEVLCSTGFFQRVGCNLIGITPAGLYEAQASLRAERDFQKHYHD